jgi:hypothetical protein
VGDSRADAEQFGPVRVPPVEQHGQ